MNSQRENEECQLLTDNDDSISDSNNTPNNTTDGERNYTVENIPRALNENDFSTTENCHIETINIKDENSLHFTESISLSFDKWRIDDTNNEQNSLTSEEGKANFNREAPLIYLNLNEPHFQSNDLHNIENNVQQNLFSSCSNQNLQKIFLDHNYCRRTTDDDRLLMMVEDLGLNKEQNKSITEAKNIPQKSNGRNAKLGDKRSVSNENFVSSTDSSQMQKHFLDGGLTNIENKLQQIPCLLTVSDAPTLNYINSGLSQLEPESYNQSMSGKNFSFISKKNEECDEINQLSTTCNFRENSFPSTALDTENQSNENVENCNDFDRIQQSSFSNNSIENCSTDYLYSTDFTLDLCSDELNQMGIISNDLIYKNCDIENKNESSTLNQENETNCTDFKYFDGKNKSETAVHKCKLCSKSYKSKHGLKYHLINSHEDDAFFCAHCDKVFDSPTKLKTHEMKYDTNLNPYKCPNCSNRYETKDKLKYHIYCMHRQTICNICNKPFENYKKLLNHKVKCPNI